ncbi:unnamed protein product, partial [Meganyctiphanes norvegica]
MNTDDIIYVCLLLGTIGFGSIFRKLPSSEVRKWVGSVMGLVMITMVSGIHVLHPLTLTAINIGILTYLRKSHIHIVSFIVSFSYLFFYRVVYYLGLPQPPNHTNAVQMMMTLKLVGLCFEVHDTWRKSGELKKTSNEEEKKLLELQLEHEEVNPSAMDVFHYAFCYLGALTGPYYKYRTYCDLIHVKWMNANVDCFKAMLNRIRVVPVYVILFLLTDYFFPLSFAESNDIFRNYSFMYRVWYMTPVFFTFRMRIYSGFVLSECVCIMAGLGAYPETCEPRPGRGPTKYQALVDSDDEKFVQRQQAVEMAFNANNGGDVDTHITASTWFCYYVTARCWIIRIVKRKIPVAFPLREALTMLTSAYWHGVHSGYYLSMLTVPFILAVEDFYERKIRRNIGQTGQYIYDWFAWFLKMQNFAYMGMAFLLLRIDTTIYYWRSIGFIYHGVMLIMYAMASFINNILGKAEKKLQKSRETYVVKDTADFGDVRLRCKYKKEEDANVATESSDVQATDIPKSKDD